MHLGLSCDGQYQAKDFVVEFVSHLDSIPAIHNFFKCHWDPSHWCHLAFSDVSEKDCAGFMAYFIKQCNTFADLFGHGKGSAILKAEAERLNVIMHVASHFAKQR